MEKKIKIIKNGPYIVTGNIPLSEYIIEKGPHGNIYKLNREFSNKATYSLCRCGRSANMPYCDGSHAKYNFIGTEKHPSENFYESAKVINGKRIDLYDDEKLCAYARFCHYDKINAWDAVRNAKTEEELDIAVKITTECPAGRLVIKDKNDDTIEPVLEESIVILQDAEKSCSGPLWIRGKIPIIMPDDKPLEVRNRVTLCRCGHSTNMPYCDASHIAIKFKDNLMEEQI